MENSAAPSSTWLTLKTSMSYKTYFNLMNLTSRTHFFLNLLTIPALTTLLLTQSVQAQHISGGRTRSDSISLYRNPRPTSSLNPDSLIQERLVQLALAGPI